MRACLDDAEPSLISDAPFGVFVSLLFSFVLLLAMALPTRLEWLWSMQGAKAASSEPALLTDSTLITIQRSGCFGECPVYTLKLWGSGKVEYDGKSWVCERGSRSASV